MELEQAQEGEWQPHERYHTIAVPSSPTRSLNRKSCIPFRLLLNFVARGSFHMVNLSDEQR
jgi:hypothetical protein